MASYSFFRNVICVIATFLFSWCPLSAIAAPVPTVSFTGTQIDVLLNQSAPIKVGFTNTGTQIGYYPMMEVKLPRGVLCDSTCLGAIELVDLSGAPVTVTAFGPAASATTYTNPITGNQVAAAVGESVLFISLPTGSVSPNQPAITYAIPATLAPSAQLAVPVPLSATGVFVLGAIPDGDRGACGAPGVDTICLASNGSIIPSILLLNKSVENLVDGATSTGPNYPRRFKLEVEVANTETVTSTAVTDTIPNTFVLTSLPGSNCKSSPGSLTFTPALSAGDTCVFTGSAAGGGTLTVTYASITGITGVDRTIQYEGYVQKFAGAVAGVDVVPPATGAPTSTTNTAQAAYTYNPGAGAQSFTSSPQSVVLEQRSLYTTKSVTKVSPAGTVIGPGNTLLHTLIYDISDYFSFDDLQISDSIGDGQTYVDGSLSVQVFEGSSTPTTRTQNQLQSAAGAPLGPITRNLTTGIWSINLNLSQALTASGPNGFGAPDGVLEGDRNRTPSAPSGTPTRIVVTYNTTIDEEFTGPVVGTPEVDGGDVISDTMGADFRVRGTSNRQTLSGPTAQVRVTVIEQFDKVIEFENGTTPGNPVEISPTETITYKISFTVPTGDVEGLKITDFVPSPLFDVLDPNADGSPSSFTFDATPSDAAPATGHMHLTTASAPVILIPTVDGVGNSLAVEFDNESNASSDETFIEFLFTMTATNNPMADDLLLVNVSYLSQNSSQSITPINQLSSVAPLLTAQPEIVVRKFASSVVSGSGSISGSGGNANFTNVQPGARLQFSVEIENTGSYDAVDLSLNDTLPAPFTYVAASLTDSNCDTGGGITDTSAANQIQVTGMEVPQGQICTLTYQVDLASDAALGGVITNTAVSRFSSTPGGPQFSPVRDTATTTTNSPSLTKTLVSGSSSDSDTAEGSLRAGESAEFDVTVSVPPGTANSFTVREIDTATGATSNNFFENFSSGTITFPSVEQNAACAGSFNFVGNTDLCFSLNPSANASQTSATEHRVNLGTVRNSSTSNQSFTFRYRATLRSGTLPGAYQNKANVQWVSQNSNSTGSTTPTLTSLTATANFTVVRPSLTLSKSTSTTPPVRLGGSVRYSVTLTNTGTSIAHDVADLVDVLPTGLGTASLVSATLNSASVTGASGFSFAQSGSRITVKVRNLSGQAKLSPGDVYVVTYSVPVTADVNGSTTSLVNFASVANYSSGSSEGGPRETFTDVPPASVSIAVDSNIITGRVIFSKETASAGNQNGVVGSTVSIVGTSFTTTVDADGNFSFSGVPDGTYTVRAVNPFGNLISEQTVVVNNADARNIVFQARPRIVLTKTTSTVGPVSPGQSITYSVKVQNLGNYPAFQVGNIQDTLVNGMGTATLVSATYEGVSVTGVSGFALTQTGLVINIPVRNTAGQPQIDVGHSFIVTYQVPVSTSLKASAITIPNSAEIPSYTTSASTTSKTESYFDVRCGEVRLDLSGTDPACVVTSLQPPLTIMDSRSQRLSLGVSRALSLRREYVKAGYCSAIDNGCYKCNASKSRCLNVCRAPSSKQDRALLAEATKLGSEIEDMLDNTLSKEQSALACAIHQDCSMVDYADPTAEIELKARRLADITADILSSCCMRTQRATAAFKKRKVTIGRESKRDLSKLSVVLSQYPSPVLVCK